MKTTATKDPASSQARGIEQRSRTAWVDAPLRLKVSALVALAMVCGVITGIVEAWSGHRVWLMMAGLAVLLTALVWLGQLWVCGPLDRLLRRLEQK